MQTDKSHYSVKKCIFLVFLKFFRGIRGFLILTGDLERRKTNVHHNPTRGRSVVVAISMPWSYRLRPYGVDRL